MDYSTSATPSSPDDAPIQDKVSDRTGPAKAGTPSRPKGPNASAIVLGLVAMAFAGLIIARETLDWRVDWSRLGPGAIVGIGVVMVVIGAIGLIRRHDDV
jgi:hypothetical protein